MDTKSRLRKFYRLFNIDVVAVAGKNWMGQNIDIQIQISVRPPLIAGQSLSWQAKLFTAADACGDFHIDILNAVLHLKRNFLVSPEY